MHTAMNMSPQRQRGLRTSFFLLLSLSFLALLCLLVDHGSLSLLPLGVAASFNPYSVLGVTRTASQAEVKKAYKKQAKMW